MYAEFDLHLPQDIGGALETLAAHADGSTLPLAGGTNLIVDLRARTASPRALVNIAGLPDLRGVGAGDGRTVIGGGTTVSDLLRTPALAASTGSLVESARVFAGQMVRNTATVAGNVCYGSPAADLVPPLLVLDAEATLASHAGTRTLPLHEFFLDYRRTACGPGELLTKLGWPTPPPASANLFYKLARRKGDAITVVGVAVALDADAGRCRRARIALGAVAPTCRRAVEAEAMLEGEAITPELVEEAARHAATEADPIDDVRASAAYRRHGVRVLTRRLLEAAWRQATERGEES